MNSNTAPRVAEAVEAHRFTREIWTERHGADGPTFARWRRGGDVIVYRAHDALGETVETVTAVFDDAELGVDLYELAHHPDEDAADMLDRLGRALKRHEGDR